MGEIAFGGITLSALLTIVMAVVFNTWGNQIDKKYRAPIAIGIGMFIGLLYLPYAGLAWQFPVILDHLIKGFMIGATSVGLYESTKKRNGGV